MVSAKLLLKQAYESSQGIFDHLNQPLIEENIPDINLKRPLASIALHPNEDVSSNSKLYTLIKVYADKKVNQYYGLNLIQFLDLPHDIVDLIITDCDNRLKKEINTTNEVLENLREPNKK